MKKDERSALHGMSMEELVKRIVEEEKKLAAIMRDRVAKQVRDVREIKRARQRIAVLKTIHREKEISHG